MRIRNRWFGGGSFLLGVFLIGCSVSSVAEMLRWHNASFLEALAVAMFLLLAIWSFRVSMLTGEYQRNNYEARQMTKQKD